MGTPAENAFLERIRANEGILRKVVHLYADQAADRDDLYQEIVYQAWRARDAFRGDAKFSTWLYRVALNTALSSRRKSARKPFTREVVETDAIEDRQQNQDTRQVLLWAIRQLKAADRMLILLHLEGYEYAEIAEITGIKPSTVGVKLHRIKKQLTTLIQREQSWT